MKNKNTGNIRFHHFPTIKYVNPILSLIYSFLFILYYRPQVILFNGATRDLLHVSIIARLINCKIIEMIASDSDLEPGKELIDRRFDQLLFRLGLKITKNFIVQNTKQKLLLKNNYKKSDPLLVPLIWIDKEKTQEEKENTELILWVSNFRELKRPEWFMQLAIDRPEQKFMMVGNKIDIDLYEKCKKQALTIPNLEFMGGLSFAHTVELFKSARIFVCTSQIEGFPNTFLQAWMNECPVLTTFDPSDLVKNLQIGVFCSDYLDLVNGFDQLLDTEFSKIVKSNISAYYKETFSAQMHYEKLINKFGLI